MTNELDIISVALVVPAVGLASFVVRHWAPKAWETVRGLRKADAEAFLILGITIGFLAFVLNSLFWGFHFLADLMQWYEIKRITYEMGPGANIVTRNLPYALAALCHLAAYNNYRKDAPRTIWFAGWAALAFLGASLLLMWIAP